MKTSDFYFSLPENLIAQRPPLKRGTSRLLILDRRSRETRDAVIGDLAECLSPGSLVVINDSRVRKARLFGKARDSGGRVEFLLLGEVEPGLWKTLSSKARKQKPGKVFLFPGGIKGIVRTGSGDFKYLEFVPSITEAYLEKHGHIPLPPYIRREDNREDQERYQTIYARSIGSAASPTAGLHFSEEILKSLEKREITVDAITLHVGAGTFLPIRSENIESHTMHEESYHIPQTTADQVNRALKDGTDILAVGTTVVRTLESACRDNKLQAGEGETDLFIYPGYRFKAVSRLLTNFHTPGSTLLALVSAFAGREPILAAYREAIKKEYRFFSYGDAMLIL